MLFKIKTFIPFFHSFFALMCGLSFAAGDVGFGGDLGGGADSAIHDAITALEGDRGGEEKAEGAEDGTERTGTGGSAEQTEEEKAAAAATAREAKFPKLSKPLAADTMKFLRDTKESNPKAYKEIMARVWEHENGSKKIAEHFPDGGLDAAIELKRNMEAEQQLLRGHEFRTVQEAMNEVAAYRGIDKKIINGDASFIRDLPDNISEGLANVMPDIIGEWATSNNDAYQKYFAQVFTKTMIGSNEYYDLKAADRSLGRMDLTNDPELKAAHDAVKGILGLVDRINQTAQKKLEPKQPAAQPDATLKERETTVRQKELKGYMNEVSTSTVRHIGPTVKEVLVRMAGKDYASKVNVREVVVKTLHNIDAAMGKDYADAIQQFVEAGDVEGAGRFVRQKLNHAAVTKATEQAFKYIYRGATLGSERPDSKKDKEKDLKNTRHPDIAAGPYKPQKMRPATHKIDMAATKAAAKKEGLTYAEFIMSRRAILAGGAKVSWEPDAEREE